LNYWLQRLPSADNPRTKVMQHHNLLVSAHQAIYTEDVYEPTYARKMSIVFTILDRKESIQVSVSNGSCTVGLCGNPWSRCRCIDGPSTLFYAKDGPVTFSTTDKLTLSWGVCGRSEFYDNRRITVTLGDKPSILYENWGHVPTVSAGESPFGFIKCFESEIIATAPTVFHLYQYRGELRVRKGRE
jgi:hypothetical protein